MSAVTGARDPKPTRGVRWWQNPVVDLVWSVGVFVILFAVFPRSGQGLTSTSQWLDQSYFLKALTDSLSTGSSDLFRQGKVGPGYISLAIILCRLTNVSPAECLIDLSEAGFFLTGLLLQVCVFKLTRGLAASARRALLAMAALFLFSSVWPVSTDIPWTHFVEVPLIVAFVLALTLRNAWPTYALCGFLFVYIYQTRAFEGEVTLIALALGGAATFVRSRFNPGAKPGLKQILTCAVSAAAGAFAAYLIIFATTGDGAVFAQYNTQDDIRLTPALLPFKFVQIFFDTCFMTVCKFAQSVPTSFLATNLEAWKHVLLLQLPSMAAATCATLFLLISSTSARSAFARFDILVSALITAGLVIAYTSGAPSGSAHLKYGFMRDFLAPTVLLFVVLCALYSAAFALSSTRRLANIGLGAFVLITAGLMLLRPIDAGIPDPYSLANISYTAQCVAQTCKFELSSRNRAGNPVVLPRSTLFEKTCGTTVKSGLTDLNEIQLDQSKCQSIQLIPTVSGLSSTPDYVPGIKQPFELPADGCSTDGSAFKVQIGAKVSMASDSSSASACLKGPGWSSPESWGTWTDTGSAELYIYLGSMPAKDLKFEFEATGFSGTASQTVDVQAGGKVVERVAVTTGKPQQYSIMIPHDAVKAGILSITFVVEHPVSPKELAGSPDDRTLGLGLSWFRLS